MTTSRCTQAATQEKDESVSGIRTHSLGPMLRPRLTVSEYPQAVIGHGHCSSASLPNALRLANDGSPLASHNISYPLRGSGTTPAQPAPPASIRCSPSSTTNSPPGPARRHQTLFYTTSHVQRRHNNSLSSTEQLPSRATHLRPHLTRHLLPPANAADPAARIQLQRGRLHAFFKLTTDLTHSRRPR